MRFFHLSDLHIGKQLHHYNLKEDQKDILQQVVRYADELHPDAIIIAGDIYDKTVPSAEAVTIFDEFLTELSTIQPAIPILIISGNHDSAERMKYAADFLKKHNIYIVGSAPGTKDEKIQQVELEDEWGTVHVYLLPFLKPSYVKTIFDEIPESYTDAVRRLLVREEIDDSKRNILVSHQFYMGNSSPETCDSETISVGGIDNVDVSIVERFDYVALGHLHGKQCVKSSHIRYPGTLLKYSVSEADQRKTLTQVTLGKKGELPEISEFPLYPLHDVIKRSGKLEELLEQGEICEDYVSITLTDEVDPYRPKEQLERVYSRILEIRVDNTRTRKKLAEFDEKITIKEPFQAFEDFYQEMQGKEMTEEQIRYMKQIFEQAREE